MTKTQVEGIVLRYAKTQNSLIKEDGSNGFNDMIDDLTTASEGVLKKTILEVGFDKNGEADFGASALVSSLTQEQMTSLRAMITVAIGTLEEMRRRSFDEQNKPGQEV